MCYDDVGGETIILVVYITCPHNDDTEPREHKVLSVTPFLPIIIP